MKIYRWAILAMLLHVGILTAFCWQWQKIAIGKNSPTIIKAFVFTKLKLSSMQNAQQPKDIKKQKSFLSHEKSVQKSSAQKNVLKYNASTGIYNALLEQLHDAIAEAQQYPAGNFQAAKVTLGFLLAENGQISQIHIIKTSGNTILDNAARSSLLSIVPFKPAHNLLQHAEHFQIDIVFEESV